MGKDYKEHYRVVRKDTGIVLQGDWDTEAEAQAWIDAHKHHHEWKCGGDYSADAFFGEYAIDHSGYDAVTVFHGDKTESFLTAPLKKTGFVIAMAFDWNNPETISYVSNLYRECESDTPTLTTCDTDPHVFLSVKEAMRFAAAFVIDCHSRIQIWEVPYEDRECDHIYEGCRVPEVDKSVSRFEYKKGCEGDDKMYRIIKPISVVMSYDTDRW